jgi:hypothetical protein
MDLKEIGCDDLESIHMAQGPVTCYCGHGNEPSGSTKDEESLD